jgi:thiol-disulfide isomerase/thioredoxin
MFGERLRQTLGVALLAGMLAGATFAAETPDHLSFQFETLDGQRASLADFSGQLVILNLWAIWCSPCLMEIPHLVALQDELDAGQATVIGLAIDSGTPRAIARFWERRLDMTPNYPIWMGTAEQAREHFDARIYPTTLIIDREGRVREILVGLQTEADFQRALAGLD